MLFHNKIPLLKHVALLLLLLLPQQACAFVGIQKQLQQRQRQRHRLPSFFAVPEDGVDSQVALPPADDSQVALPPAAAAAAIEDDPAASTTGTTTTASTAFMMSQSMRRTLIEELGYRRQDVDCMRVELAGPILEKRLRCPPEGMPESWKMETTSSTMMERLENESKYPLKVPLLGVSLVLGGKGLSDAIITAIKVNMGYPGALAEFMGVPLLAIDFVCVVVGIALGTWTWKNMRDN